MECHLLMCLLGVILEKVAGVNDKTGKSLTLAVASVVRYMFCVVGYRSVNLPVVCWNGKQCVARVYMSLPGM